MLVFNFFYYDTLGYTFCTPTHGRLIPFLIASYNSSYLHIYEAQRVFFKRGMAHYVS